MQHTDEPFHMFGRLAALGSLRMDTGLAFAHSKRHRHTTACSRQRLLDDESDNERLNRTFVMSEVKCFKLFKLCNSPAILLY